MGLSITSVDLHKGELLMAGFLVTPPAMVRVDFKSYSPSQLGMFSRHYTLSQTIGSGATMNLADAVNAIDLLFTDAIVDLLQESTRLMFIDAQAYSIVGGVVSDAPISDVFRKVVDEPGITVGDLLPTQVSGIIALKTGLPGRNHRGRNYIPFPSEDDNVPIGKPEPGYVGRLQTLADAMSATVVVTSDAVEFALTPGIFSRAGLNIVNLALAIPEEKWATQRRRGNFGHPNTP